MPVPPNQRRKAASVMTLPSGVVDAAPGVLRVTGMPHGGIVRVNGNELTGIGWADPETMTQYDLQAGDMMVVRELRITDANGVDYLLPNDTSLINHLNGGHYVGFSDFVRQGPIPVNLGIGLIPATTLPPRRSITDVSTDDSIDRSGGPRIMVGVGVGLVPGARSGPGDVFSITGVPSDVVSLIVQENGRVLSGTLASGTWTASSFDVSDAAVISVQPTTAGGVMGEGVRGRALTRTVAIPAAGLSIAYSTLAAPTTQYRRVGEGQTTPPAMTGIVLVGDIGSIGGATFSLDGVAVPYAPGAAQWLPTTPAYTKLFIPAPAGAHVVRLIKGGETRRADAAVAAGQVTEIPVSNMTVETRSTTQQVTNSNTGIVLVGDIGSIGGATFSLDGVAVPYAPGAAQWLATTPAYTKLFIPAPAGAHAVRLIKGGETRRADAAVAAGQVTEIPVTGMQQELVEIQKSEDKKDKAPPAVLTPVEPVGPIGPPPVVYPPQTRLPQPQPGMSMTSKLIIGGLVAAALGGGYYWYSTRPKANPGKKDCGCGCGGKGGCGG